MRYNSDISGAAEPEVNNHLRLKGKGQRKFADHICGSRYDLGEGKLMSENRKTALVLGGGGSRGAYEIGVWQALREMDITIDLVTGSSVGSINGAMIAQDKFDLSVTLWKQLETGMVFDLSLGKNGPPPLRGLLEQYIDESAVRKSPVEFGLVTLEFPSMVPRHLFLPDIPEGKLIDFILASSSVFPAIKPQAIDNVKYVDGGYTDNVPVEMALQKGATQIIAVDLEAAGIVRKGTLKKAENLILLRPNANLGSMLVFRGENASRIMRLGYLDTLKAFGFYWGTYFTFAKNSGRKKSLENAETAGRIFGLDPGILYTMEQFDLKLKEAAGSYGVEIKKELDESRSHIRQKKLSLEGLLALVGKANQKTVTLILADFLANSNHPGETVAVPLFPVLKDELKAAAYLAEAGITRKG